MQRAAIAAGAAALFALLALLAWGLVLPGGAAGSTVGVNGAGSAAPLVARPAPPLRLALFGAAPAAGWGLAEQRGKWVVVNFWASWCAPCRGEAAVLEQAAGDYAARGVALVGVNVWDDDEAARGFLREFAVTYPNGRDASGAAAVDYGVTGIPETYVVAPDGTLLRRWVGPVSRAALDGMLTP